MSQSWRRIMLLLATVLLPATAMAAELTATERQLLTSRTVIPQPSPSLSAALDLDIPDWHKPGATPLAVKLGPDVKRASAQAALDAMQALDPGAAQNDFDRAWLSFQTAAALRDVGRGSEAIAMFEQLLGMPRTQVQDRYTLAALHALGDASKPGWCEGGHLNPPRGWPHPGYPPAARTHGIEGWVHPILDIAADGTIEYVAIESSSLRIFEQPTIDWLLKAHYQTQNGNGSGQPCFARMQAHFRMHGDARFEMGEIPEDQWNFSYPSIGASRRVRAAAIEALQHEAAGRSDDKAGAL